ncbi:hypothetical protein OAM96_04540 [Candidatus Poseidoniaceae archaeon]|nr:hypothetical protein [Candidatus Poseidoniaceae archaeon]
MATNREQMNMRIQAGEFGNPVDLNKVNDAWAAILEEEVAKSGKTIYHSISGLWPQNTGKVAFNGRTTEQVTIPMGAKILCFKRDSDNENAPALGLVWVEE